jgi:cobyrinic acid a,c-diamide synthase
VTTRGVIIAAPRSGSGKTLVTLGALALLIRRGTTVRAAKSGPDYIDPAFHAAAAHSACINLDSWAMPPALLDGLMQTASEGAELLLIEGAMGLFDGLAGPLGRCGSVADLARRYRLPVLLVLDVSGQSQTAAAVVRGLASHDPEVKIAAVVLNRVGSERHREAVADAIDRLGIPVIGAIPRDSTLSLPERHLGLVQASEHADLAERIERLIETIGRNLDLDALIALATPLAYGRDDTPPSLPPPGQRIALAFDQAFSFIYPHVLEGWRRMGAEIVRFSPLADQSPPPDCDCCWLPGGYPELHAGPLAAARRFHDGLARFAATRPVHGECGGYMVLGEGLEDTDRNAHAMAGLLGHATSFARRQLHLGYRQASLLIDSPIGSAGRKVRGHEFHYSTLLKAGLEEPLVRLSDGQGRSLGDAGSRRGLVTGTFFHAIAQQNDQNGHD